MTRGHAAGGRRTAAAPGIARPGAAGIVRGLAVVVMVVVVHGGGDLNICYECVHPSLLFVNSFPELLSLYFSTN